MKHIGPKLRSIGILVFLVLAGCGSAGALPKPPDTTPIQQHIDTAASYINAGFALVDTCIAAKLPLCSSPAFQAGVATAKAVATEALAEAKKQAAQGADADLVQTTLRVGMNAILLFYTLK